MKYLSLLFISIVFLPRPCLANEPTVDEIVLFLNGDKVEKAKLVEKLVQRQDFYSVFAREKALVERSIDLEAWTAAATLLKNGAAADCSRKNLINEIIGHSSELNSTGATRYLDPSGKILRIYKSGGSQKDPLVIEIIKSLSRDKSCLEARSKDGKDLLEEMPPLINAIWSLKGDLALTLIESGADLNSRTANTGLFPVLAAVQTQQPAVLEELLKKGADVNHVTRDGCLSIAYTDNRQIRDIFKKYGSWEWPWKTLNSTDGSNDRSCEISGCLKGDLAKQQIARKFNVIGFDLYKKEAFEYSAGYFKAAAFLDCEYLIARTNLASVHSLRKNYPASILALQEALALDEQETLKKVKSDPDYANLKGSLEFKQSDIGKLYARNYGTGELTSARQGRFPLKLSDDELNVTYKERNDEKKIYHYQYFLTSKKRGTTYIFNGCRVHYYHYCTKPTGAYIYDLAKDRLTLFFECITAGEGSGSAFTGKATVDLTSMKPIDDEYSQDECKDQY